MRVCFCSFGQLENVTNNIYICHDVLMEAENLCLGHPESEKEEGKDEELSRMSEVQDSFNFMYIWN